VKSHLCGAGLITQTCMCLWAKKLWQRANGRQDKLGFCTLPQPGKHRTRTETTSFQIDAYNLDDVGFRIQNSPQFNLLSNETAR
jgi:hypothetical protein